MEPAEHPFGQVSSRLHCTVPGTWPVESKNRGREGGGGARQLLVAEIKGAADPKQWSLEFGLCFRSWNSNSRVAFLRVSTPNSSSRRVELPRTWIRRHPFWVPGQLFGSLRHPKKRVPLDELPCNPLLRAWAACALPAPGAKRTGLEMVSSRFLDPRGPPILRKQVAII